jgi:hypothetical protein
VVVGVALAVGAAEALGEPPLSPTTKGDADGAGVAVLRATACGAAPPGALWVAGEATWCGCPAVALEA